MDGKNFLTLLCRDHAWNESGRESEQGSKELGQVLNTFFFPIQTLTQEVEVLVYPTLFFFQYDLHSKLAHAGPLSAPNLNTKFKKAAKLHV